MSAEAQQFESLMEKGNTCFKEKKYDEAIPIYKQAAATLNSSSAHATGGVHRAQSNLAACYAAKGDWQASLAAAEACTRANPSFLKGWGRLGTALKELKRYGEALSAYGRALALDATAATNAGYADRMREIGDLMVAQQNSGSGSGGGSSNVLHTSNFSTTTNTTTTTTTGGSGGGGSTSSNQTERDNFYYKKSLEKGTEAMKTKVYPEAVRHFSKALEVSSSTSAGVSAQDLAALYANRSAAYYRLNKFLESADDAKKSVAKNPNYARGFVRLGEASLSLGEFPAAREAFEKAAKIDPENTVAKEGVIKMRELAAKDAEEERRVQEQAERRIQLKQEEARKEAELKRMKEEEEKKAQQKAMADLGLLGRVGGKTAGYLYCKYCNKYGHLQSNCPLKAQRSGNGSGGGYPHPPTGGDDAAISRGKRGREDL